MKVKSKNIDSIDEKILESLYRNSRLSMTELGEVVNLSSQAVKNRLERLSEIGVVKKYTLNINCPVYGYKVHAIITLQIKPGCQNLLSSFLKKGHYHYQHCYQITGKQSYYIDCYYKDQAELQEFLDRIDEFGSYEVQIILSELELEN